MRACGSRTGASSRNRARRVGTRPEPAPPARWPSESSTSLSGEFAEEDALDLGGAQQLGGRTRQDRAPRLEHHAAVGELERELDVLLDEKDADALLVADPAHQNADLLHHPWREPEERLVDHQELRLRHQAARDGHHLLLAARKGVRELRAA